MVQARGSVTLFAWATPAYANGSPVDHTWVTTYDNRVHTYPNEANVAGAGEDYWFSWGSFHATGGTKNNAAGHLGQQTGDIALARCLVQSNADCQSAPAARGTIFVYGVDGVCHQLANQVLFASGYGVAPLTVRLARGYVASTFVYGTYGLQHAAWASKVRGCSVANAPLNVQSKTVTSDLPGDATMTLQLPDQQDDFEIHAREVLGADVELLSRLLVLKGDVNRFAAQAIPGFERPSAAALNARNQHLIDQAAILLGREKFELVFGFPPADTIDLVDPTIEPR